MHEPIDPLDIHHAASLLAGMIARTPVVRFPELEERLGCRVFLKCENLQVTRSFKVRGALNAILQLSAAQRRHGVVARSSGNFAIGVAHASKVLGVPASVLMPTCVAPVKLRSVRALGSDVELAGDSLADCRERQLAIAAATGQAVLSSYDDRHVVAGQGTVALEVLQDVPHLTHFYGPVGGGGLLSGCALALRAAHPTVQVVAVEPHGMTKLADGLRLGRPVTLDAMCTIADGLRVNALGQLNWPILARHTNLAVAVTDGAIREAIELVHTHLHMLVEPSGAVALAGLLTAPPQAGADVVCVISGGNIDAAAQQSANAAA